MSKCTEDGSNCKPERNAPHRGKTSDQTIGISSKRLHETRRAGGTELPNESCFPLSQPRDNVDRQSRPHFRLPKDRRLRARTRAGGGCSGSHKPQISAQRVSPWAMKCRSFFSCSGHRQLGRKTRHSLQRCIVPRCAVSRDKVAERGSQKLVLGRLKLLGEHLERTTSGSCSGRPALQQTDAWPCLPVAKCRIPWRLFMRHTRKQIATPV